MELELKVSGIVHGHRKQTQEQNELLQPQAAPHFTSVDCRSSGVTVKSTVPVFRNRSQRTAACPQILISVILNIYICITNGNIIIFQLESF